MADGAENSSDKYSLVKSRIDKCIAALVSVQEGRPYEKTHINYGWHIISAAIKCIPDSIREPLKVAEVHKGCSVTEMFSEGKHNFMPINCYIILNCKKEPEKIVSAFTVLESIIMDVNNDSIKNGKIAQTIDLFKSARTALDDPKNLY